MDRQEIILLVVQVFSVLVAWITSKSATKARSQKEEIDAIREEIGKLKGENQAQWRYIDASKKDKS